MPQPIKMQPHANASDARLLLAFGGPEWAWLRRRLRHALTHEKPLPNACRLRNPSQTEWDAATALLGRSASRPGKTLRVSIADLEARLIRAGLCASLREALENIEGPIRSRPAETKRENARWDKVVADYKSQAADWHKQIADTRPDLDMLAASLARIPNDASAFDRAAWRSLCQRDAACAKALLADLTAVFKALVDAGPTDIPRTHLAACAVGDSHALDGNTLLCRALARIAQQPNTTPREVWTYYRVLPDEVSSSVLILNLRLRGGPLAHAINGFADAGEPYRLLLRQCGPLLPQRKKNASIYVCENPSVLEAAAIKHSVNSAPMICTEGQPSRACQNLLIACAEQSLPMCYHGDFDWGGIRIANTIHRIVPNIVPWRYRSSDYEALAGGAPLEGTPVDACWDPLLRPAMASRNQAFHEEQTLTDLLADLVRPKHHPDTRLEGSLPPHRTGPGECKR